MARLVLRRVEEEFAANDHRRMLQLAERTGATMQEFLKRVTVRKIDRLSTLVTESFQYLLRKSSLVRRISIDPLTFAITLDDGAGRCVPNPAARGAVPGAREAPAGQFGEPGPERPRSTGAGPPCFSRPRQAQFLFQKKEGPGHPCALSS
jgi:hypothetical protein